jgi:hypothetical protein
MPSKILAAFQLPFYDGKACAVITDNEIRIPANHIFIFHEFVHCYQIEHGEMEIKAKLDIYKEAMLRGDIMWEINHPFPYNDKQIISITKELYQSYEESNHVRVDLMYEQLKKQLNKVDYEYLVWQEWKEGYARWVENKIRSKLGLEINTTSIDSSMDRTIFYDLGSKHINIVTKTIGQIDGDILKLYNYMMRM